MREINKSIPKVDGKNLVLGKAKYTDDMTDKNYLIVKIMRSPHAFAKIISINKEKAEQMDGIECVITYKDINRIPFTRAGQAYPEPSSYDKFILDEYVRYVGDDVAIVAGIDEETVDNAMALIDVEYEVFEPVLDMELAEGHSSVIHGDKKDDGRLNIGTDFSKNIAATINIANGNVDEAMAKCEVIVESSYTTQATDQTMMETFRTACYLDQYDRLVVITATQIPFHVKRFLSKALELSSNKIRVIKPRIGGGFGAKQSANSEFYPALVTIRTGKPSKIIYSRKENFESGSPRHPMRLNVKIGSDSLGNIKAIDIDGISDTGAYGEHAYAVFLQSGMKSLGLYNKVEASRFRGKTVYTNHTTRGAFRGYGATQGIFALESTINEIAVKLKMDPTEIRLKNMIKKGETAIKFNFNDVENMGPSEIMDSCALDYCIEKGKELIDWDTKYPKQQVGEEKVRSVGMAIARQGSGIANVDMGSATINFLDDGMFSLLIGATDLGTGSDTILSQICAETLGVSVDKIVVYSSDTDITPYDGGAYASSTTYVTGNAIKRTANKIRELLIEEGSKILKVDESMLTLDAGLIEAIGTDKSITLKELSSKLVYSCKQITATDSFVCYKSPPPYMAGFVEIEIDMGTGKVDVLNFSAVMDIGTVINPNLARIQVEGGVVQGIGMALFEEVKYDESGKMISNSFQKYKVPTRLDVGNIDVEFAESYEPSGPFGAKSVGEVVINTACPAIVDAIYNATGVRFRNLPITSEKVLKSLKS